MQCYMPLCVCVLRWQVLMLTSITQVLEERMEYYSRDEKADTINRVRGGISEVKYVMIENIEKVCHESAVFISMSKPHQALLECSH